MQIKVFNFLWISTASLRFIWYPNSSSVIDVNLNFILLEGHLPKIPHTIFIHRKHVPFYICRCMTLPKTLKSNRFFPAFFHIRESIFTLSYKHVHTLLSKLKN